MVQLNLAQLILAVVVGNALTLLAVRGLHKLRTEREAQNRVAVIAVTLLVTVGGWYLLDYLGAKP